VELWAAGIVIAVAIGVALVHRMRDRARDAEP